MHIEWNRVTWYSKALAIIVFVATFFIGFGFGSLYQQNKDYSITYLTTPQSTSLSNVPTSTNQIPDNRTNTTTTQYKGMLICKNNSDCPTDDLCLRPGPIIAGQDNPKVCVPSGQAIPL